MVKINIKLGHEVGFWLQKADLNYQQRKAIMEVYNYAVNGWALNYLEFNNN
jgi:hypothetical protein